MAHQYLADNAYCLVGLSMLPGNELLNTAQRRSLEMAKALVE